MSEKSHVGMEYKICPVTGKKFSTDAILFDTRLKKSLERETVTGLEVCPDVQEKIDEGFICLVEIDESKSQTPLTPHTAHRTGNLCYLKKEAFLGIFGEQFMSPRNWVYIQEGVIDKLNQMKETP